MLRTISRLSVVLVVLYSCQVTEKARATTLFSEDFEGGNLDQWTGKNGGAHQGIIVSDPLCPGNNVLSFSGLENAGDVFSSEIVVSVGQPITISFEYLGLALPQSVPDDFGGFLGVSDETNPLSDRVDVKWLAGSLASYMGPGYSLEQHLIDDNEWRAYEITIPNLFPSFHLMIEDWISSGGVAGDVFFDNISVVPEPSSLTLAALALFGLLAHGRRRSKR